MTRVLEARGRLVASALAVALSISFPGVARAIFIDPGFILFETWPVSAFFFAPPVPNPQFVDFEGDPLGLFDFGSGPIFVGNSDTIVERIQGADLGGGSDTIDIELVALSLKSVSPVDLGFGAGFEDISILLNTSSPSLQSNMTIFDTGTFDWVLNFSFDVIGSIGGFYATLEKTLFATDEEWQQAPTGSLVIDGVNHLLNGLDESEDFWPLGLVIQDDGAETATHTVKAASVPEPGSLLLVGVGLVGLAARRSCKELSSRRPRRRRFD